MTNYDIIISGSGGQGLMFIGKMLAKLAVDVYPHVTFIPTYGAEVRGGTSYCQVRLSNDPIATPLVEHANLMVLANQPSVDRFLPVLAEGGKAFVNSSMAQASGKGVLALPATETALEIGDVQATNVVMLAVLLACTGIIDRRRALDEVAKASARKGERATEINRQAFEKGWALGNGNA
jgi:2-oxoglutarate ferredoxin oxidoreductase subunit gamma